MDDSQPNTVATSPAAAGPAGAGFEAKLGAYFLLGLLAQSAPRALPGTVTVKVAFQRASEGYPLDDVIVHADLNDGSHATLQIQAKRTITFSPQDSIFEDVVAQIAKAAQQPGFWDGRNEIALATPRTTTKIAGAYQDVLKWARDIGSHDEFFARLARPGAANPDMRAFVDTFRANLKQAGAPHDNLTLWRILGRFHILIFDFESSGSLAEMYALAHARTLLPPDRAADAGTLWSTLTAIVLDKAATGGDLDHPTLLHELANRGMQSGNDRALLPVLRTIQSEAQLALTDIGTTIGSTRLARHEQMSKARDALDSSRFVLIRGDAGVGKSAILRQLAEGNAEDAPVLVLAPGHIAPNGFLAQCRRLEYQGTTDDLLIRLAATGSATIFIDNLDRFTEDERVTIKDVLRIASRLTGIKVVATARASSGNADDDWLPEEAIAALGGETTVLIQDLSPNDLDEIRAAEPHLRHLLSDTHPAKAVVRNLFRLSRIARLPAGEDIPTTELAMATHWWDTADGPETGRRERQRVLRKVGDAVLLGDDVVDLSDQGAPAIDALIRSETLLDRGSDRATLRHDVLREWAAANRLINEPSLIAKLDLSRPAGPVLARAVELAARASLERDSPATSWNELLNAVSGPSHHASWRRAVLLAAVNSEAADVLNRQSAALLADDAKLLCETTRAVRAANVVPGEVFLRDLLPQGTTIPKGIFIPRGSAWPRLGVWLIENFDSIPPPALKDAVDLFWDWILGSFNRNPLTPLMLDCIYPLLRLHTVGEPSPLDQLSGGERRALVQSLKTTFLTLCAARPEYAADYITLLAEDPDRSLYTLADKAGELPKAAPQQFADLLRATIIKPNREKHFGSYDLPEGLTHIDISFFPPSEKTRAFADLLTHAPSIALSLIRDIVAYATDVRSDHAPPPDDGITLVIDGADRFFPLVDTYRWARGDGPDVVTAALSALREWAVTRVESGDTLAAVIGDVLGPPGTCAAFVLVALDVLRTMANFPLEAAIPFVGSPELLCLDRQNGLLDQIQPPRSLLPARRSTFNAQGLPTLEYFLELYASPDNGAPRQLLQKRLQDAAQPLGPPEADSNFGDPRVMALLALNRINPDNWAPDPQDPSRLIYVSPPEEAQREKALQAAGAPETGEFTIHTHLQFAVSRPDRCTPAFAQTIAEWIADADAAPDDKRAHPDEQDRLRAAYLVLRHGSDDTFETHGAKAIEALFNIVGKPHDPYVSSGQQLPYNATALAFAGLFYAYRRRPSVELAANLFHLASTNSLQASVGANAISWDIAAADPRLAKALVRKAFVLCVKPRHSSSFDDAKDDAARASHASAVEAHLSTEIAWLHSNGPEPAWPAFPIQAARKRRGFRIPSPDGTVPPEPPRPKPSKTIVDEHIAAAWLPLLDPLCHGPNHADVIALVERYKAYTTTRNGAGLERHADVEDYLRGGWNEAYYALVSQIVHVLTPEQIDTVCDAITNLPDRSFLDVAPALLNPLQALYFGGTDIETQTIKIRAGFMQRLFETSQWKRHIRTPTEGVETHLTSAIPPFLFGYYGLAQVGCSLRPEDTDRLLFLLPGTSDFFSKGPTLFTAGLALSLLELKVDPRLLPFAVDVAEALLAAHPTNTVLWNDYALGRRWCRWLDALHAADPTALGPSTPIRARLHAVLGRLANIGIPEAAVLERKL